ncbi:MAG: (deoxy)nucleoside triphosphate pyrophosphohydrolase [bacterium]|nr:(deoxy)nucleoside triphosphate pyrophosphohydrolase [bacterium]
MKQVTAAIITQGDKILIARRRDGGRLGGFWEFPGGKIEPGETPEECLARELREEFEITVRVGYFVASSIYDYGDFTIELLGYETEYVSGTFKLNDHSEIRWVTAVELLDFELAPADIPIAKRLLLNLSSQTSTLPSAGL